MISALKSSLIRQPLLQKESKLIFVASQVMQMKDELEREHERKMTEMREAARRMKDDCSHQVEMERFSDITYSFSTLYPEPNAYIWNCIAAIQVQYWITGVSWQAAYR